MTGTTTVTGTTVPNAKVDVDTVNIDIDGAAHDSDHHVRRGRLVQRARHHATGHGRDHGRCHRPGRRDRLRPVDRRSSTSSPARWCSARPTPTGDDNGPGTYAYPTVAALQARGPTTCSSSRCTTAVRTVTFRVQTGDLSPTFGSPLGAQLVDVYVDQPVRWCHLDRRVVPAAQLHDRPGLGVEPADRGAGLRPAVRRRRRRHGGFGADPRGLAVTASSPSPCPRAPSAAHRRAAGRSRSC